jgi:hypothetical protein
LLPSRDYEDDSIRNSPLQMGLGTVLLLDETIKRARSAVVGPADGASTNAESRQVRVKSSVKALKSIVQRQVLPVKFDYYEVSVPTDSPVILLSSVQGGSIFTSSGNGGAETQDDYEGGTIVRVSISPLVDASRNISYIRLSPGAQVLRHMRNWWAANRLRTATMSETVIRRAENDFVKARTAAPTTVSAEDFHRWVTMARLNALSCGSGVVTEQHWDEMMELDRHLHARS